MSKGLVLVSGATGFVGTAVARAFVEAGYLVRGTSRTQAKATQWAIFNPEHAVKVEWIIVPDAGVPNSFDEAVKGVDYVVHTASPFHYHSKDPERDMLIPAVEGTKNMLAAAKKESRIKHMVITSSVAACADPMNQPGIGTTYTRDSWNPATWEQAKTIPHPAFTYCASKKFAEKAAWDDTERSFPITAICPTMVFGPPHQPIDNLSALNNSIIDLYNIMQGQPLQPTIVPFGIDVRDVATMHVNALASPPPPGSPSNAQRFLTNAWEYFFGEFADTLLSSPELTTEKVGVDFKTRVSSDRSAGAPFEHFALDAGPSETLLGRPFIGKERSFVDTAVRLLELEKKLSA